MKTMSLKAMTGAALIALASMFVSCNNVREEAAAERSAVKVHFSADELVTRASFGEKEEGVFPTCWSEDDRVKLALNYTEAAEAEVIPEQEGRYASFDAEINPAVTQAPYTFYAVSPADAAKALSPSRKAWNVTILSEQTPIEGSPDEGAMLLVAASAESPSVPNGVELHFSHLTAYGRLSFKNLTLDEATVSSIELTTLDTPFVGDWYWNTEDGSLVDNGASSTLTLNTSETENIWFACAPVDMSGKTLRVTVFTDHGSLTREITFPENRRFQPGRIAVFSVDMAGVAIEGGTSDQFELVKDESVLQAGDEVIIANQEGTYGLGAQNTGGKTPYRQAVAIQVSDGVITDAGQAEVLTLAAGIDLDTWAFLASDGYLTTTSTKNSLSTEKVISATSSWEVSITSSGDATVMAQSGSYNYMRFNYNSGNYPRFSGYGSNSSIKDPVAIYRKGGAGAGPVERDPLTHYHEYGCYLLEKQRIYVAGQDQIFREYNGTALTWSLLDPATNEQLEISGYDKTMVKGDDVEVTLTWRKGRTQIVSGQTHKLKVVKEEGPMVWLGNGSGSGVIIKK